MTGGAGLPPRILASDQAKLGRWIGAYVVGVVGGWCAVAVLIAVVWQ
jgi:hypothetical protein